MDHKAADYVLLADIAIELGMSRSHCRKYVLAQGFQFSRIKTHASGGQSCLALPAQDAEALRQTRSASFGDGPALGAGQKCWFYVIQPVPELDPRRVKVGIAADVDRRLADYKTICPGAGVLRVFPCQPSWESAAIASMTREECTQLGVEVYECADLNRLTEQAEAFFALMPDLDWAGR